MSKRRWGSGRSMLPWLLTALTLLSVTLFLFIRPGDLTRLSPESLLAARTQWKTKGPSHYRLDVVVSGTQRGSHHIEVKNGQVVSMATDGKSVPQHTWSYWNVEGLFRFLDEDLLQAKHPETAFQTTEPDKVYLAVQFDEALGYPKRYLRQVFGRTLTVEWRITLF